jgi:hypothetical protein
VEEKSGDTKLSFYLKRGVPREPNSLESLPLLSQLPDTHPSSSPSYIMGVYTKLAEEISEVDVIIAGGKFC